MLIRSLYFFIVAAVLSSCASFEVLSIDVLKPAEHSLQPEIKSVVLVDNSIVFRGKDVHNVKTPISKFTLDSVWFDEYSTQTLSALKDELQSRNFFDSVYLHPTPLKQDERLISRALSWQQVDGLCKQYNAQAVIAFEVYVYNTKTQLDPLYDGNMLGYMDASGAILWRGYNNLTKELIYKETQIDTISWDVLGSGIDQISKGLPSVKIALNDLAVYQGVQAADHTTPRWESQQRGYYTTGNYYFMQAAEFVRKDQWGEAIKLWKYAFDHYKKKNKARAAYNLALASEMLDDYDSAGYWLQEGLGVLGEMPKELAALDKKRMISYSIYMEKRLKAIKDLKKQIGGIK